MNPKQKSLTRVELDTIAAWADKQLADKIAKGEIINNPAGFLAWRTNQLEAQALQDPATRRQLARYADAWGIGRTSTAAYSAPIQDVPHPKATPSQVARWVALQRVLLRLPVEHWLREHIISRLMEPRRPELPEDGERTEEDEIRADAEALIVLAELEQLIAQNADEIKALPAASAQPILRAMP